MEEFINEKALALSYGMSESQIKDECWEYALKNSIGILTLDATIRLAMDIYAAIVAKSADL